MYGQAASARPPLHLATLFPTGLAAASGHVPPPTAAATANAIPYISLQQAASLDCSSTHGTEAPAPHLPEQTNRGTVCAGTSSPACRQSAASGSTGSTSRTPAAGPCTASAQRQRSKLHVLYAGDSPRGFAAMLFPAPFFSGRRFLCKAVKLQDVRF